jgi:hypothetical protein
MQSLMAVTREAGFLLFAIKGPISCKIIVAFDDS